MENALDTLSDEMFKNSFSNAAVNMILAFCTWITCNLYYNLQCCIFIHHDQYVIPVIRLTLKLKSGNPGAQGHVLVGDLKWPGFNGKQL